MFEEHKYEELKKLGLELHIPIVESFLDLEVKNKDGNLIQKHTQRGHSWVRNAYNTLFSMLAGKNLDDVTFGAGLLSHKDTAGVIKKGEWPTGFDYSVDGTDYGYRAGAAIATWGLLVGSGTNAESFEDYALQTQIAEGTSGGQLSHVQTQAHSTTYTAGTKVFKNDLVRYFNNNSGGSVSVNEVALVANIKQPEACKIVQSRDHLASTVTIADTGQLKVTYTIQITYAG